MSGLHTPNFCKQVNAETESGGWSEKNSGNNKHEKRQRGKKEDTESK